MFWISDFEVMEEKKRCCLIKGLFDQAIRAGLGLEDPGCQNVHCSFFVLRLFLGCSWIVGCALLTLPKLQHIHI